MTTLAVLSLALGMGANAAVFSLFYQMLLRPLPVSAPDRLVTLIAPGPKSGRISCDSADHCQAIVSYPMFRDLERAQTSFTGIAGYRPFDANLAYRGETVKGRGMLVSGSYFPVLGVQPATGRLLSPADDRVAGESPVVVLSHAYWMSRFGGNPAVLEDTMVINGRTMTIAGVAPQGFTGTKVGVMPQVFVPITMRWSMEPGRETGPEDRRSYWVDVFARLKPDVSPELAATTLNAPYRAILSDIEAPLQEGMTEQMMAQFKAKTIRLEPGRYGQRDASTQVPLMLLLGVTALVLLIACVNIANLLLARVAARAHEMATRLSIGASRWQLIAQLLTESSVLALLGGIAGLLVAQWTMSVIQSLVPEEVAAGLPLHLDGSALIVTAALAVGTSLLVGLLPARQAMRTDVSSLLKGQTGQMDAGRGTSRFRVSLATAQIALSTVLIILSGLFTKSLLNISRVDLGMDVNHVLLFGISPGRNGYTPARTAVLFEQLENELAALPGVSAVAFGRVRLFAGSERVASVVVHGSGGAADMTADAHYDDIGPSYFRTLDIPVIGGREFTRADVSHAPSVAIVNERFAEKFNLGRDVLGRRISRRGAELEIVGLMKDTKHANVADAIRPMFFVPYSRTPDVSAMTFYVRTSQDPEQVLPAVRDVVASLDPHLPVENLRAMAQQVRSNSSLARFMSLLTAAFAALATLLAAIGLYGVLAFTLAQRTREIGLRIALGATRGRVRTMVARQVGVMLLVGGTIGLAAGIAIARSAQALLFGLSFHDPGVVASALVVLTLVACLAAFLPTRRAVRIDPMRALRYE